MRNLTWEQLAKYGIKQSDARGVKYKKSHEGASQSASAKAGETQDKTHWQSEFKGKMWVFARVGFPYEESFLKNLGMKLSEKDPGLYFSSAHTEDIWTELEKMAEFQKNKKE
jgi:hypothetical protein